MNMNYLQAVFWDYPELNDVETIRQYLRHDEDAGMQRWLLQRFLEYGRVVDTLSFFTLDVIAKELPRLKLQSYTRKKWRRILEVYAPAPGK